MPVKTTFNNSSMIIRLKREEDIERLAAECDKLQKGMNAADAMSGASFGLAMLSIATLIPGVGAVLGGVLIGSAVGKNVLGNAMVEKGCSDMPMKKLEVRLNKKLNAISRKLDQQSEILKDISEKVSKTLSEIEDTRKDMNEGFLLTIRSMKELDTSHPISVIKTVAASLSFSENNKMQAKKLQYTNILKQEIADEFLYSYIKPQGTLYEALFLIINRNNAKPENIDDQNAYNALSALSFGTLTYVSIFLSLIDQYTYVAEYCYQTHDLEKFNEYLDRLVFYFPFFKLIINKSTEGLIDKVIGILSYARDSHNLIYLNGNLYVSLQRQIDTLEQFKSNVKDMSLPVIPEPPVNDIDINFNSNTDSPRSTTDFLDWKKGSKVSYALQYEKNGKYSKISDWVSQDVRNTANPIIELRNKHATNRLVFRKFNNNPPELIHVFSGYSLSFRDVDRDMYNLAFKHSYDDEELIERFFMLRTFGANLAAEFEGKRNVLHAAAATGRIVLLTKIIDYSEEPLLNKKDSLGLTPLHIAAENNKAEFMRVLIEEKADVNAKTDHFNLTPLHFAVLHQCEKCVDYLLSSEDIRPNDSDNSGKTPLHFAVTDNSVRAKIFDKLVNSAKVDVNAKDSLGLTPLHTAVLLNSTANFFILERKDLDLHAKDNNGMAPLHYAAMSGFIGPLSGIILTNIDGINEAVTERKWTPLHFAAYFKHKEVISLLVRSQETKDKVMADLPDADLQTPLHLAAANGMEESVSDLIFPGQAKVYRKTAEGYTPLSLAILHRHEKAVKEIVLWEREYHQQMENGSYIADYDPLACGIAITQQFMFEYLAQQFRCEFGRLYPQGPESEYKKRSSNIEIEAVESIKNFYPHIFLNENSQIKAKHLKDSFKSNEDLGIKDYNVLNADVNGALLLLDLFVRKYTNEKFSPELKSVSSHLDERVQALKITENLEKVLSMISSETSLDDLDFFDVYSNIYKAITSRDGRQIVKTLCSFIKEYSALSPEDVEEIITTVSLDESEKKQIDASLKRLIEQTCYSNKHF